MRPNLKLANRHKNNNEKEKQLSRQRGQQQQQQQQQWRMVNGYWNRNWKWKWKWKWICDWVRCGSVRFRWACLVLSSVWLWGLICCCFCRCCCCFYGWCGGWGLVGLTAIKCTAAKDKGHGHRCSTHDKSHPSSVQARVSFSGAQRQQQQRVKQSQQTQ